MPRYAYVCGCGMAILRAFAMQAICESVRCERCGGEAKRVFTPPQIQTASLFSEANKRGLAELDATRRQEEQVYARNWDRPLPRL